MFKYTGPKCRLCKREQQDLFLKSKPAAKKCNLRNKPGQHGQKMYRISAKCISLREKQKAKRIYNLTEKSFRRYYTEAAKDSLSKENKLVDLLESRLDSTVYRSCLALTRAHARQIVGHKMISVNGKVCNIPSRKVVVGDTITLNAKMRDNLYVCQALQLNRFNIGSNWLQIDPNTLEVYKDKVVDIPREHRDFVEKHIIEFYASK